MTDKAVGVRLSADISGYVSAMGQAAQATRQVSASAQDAGKKASASFGSGLASAAKVGATALTATAAAATALGVAAFKGGVSYNALQQSSRAALTTILKGSTAANAQMDKLDAFAKNSPFAKQIFINAQQQLLGFGLEAEKVIPALDAIQNSVAAVGGSNDDIANVTDALAKMLGQGKLAGDTLNRLGMYGIDAASIIGKAVGKTGAEIRDMASKPGGIPADKVWDILVNGLQDRFGGAAANVKKTWVGATDRIKGAWRDMGSALAEPFVGHKGGGLAIEWVNKFADLMRAVEKQVAPLVDALLPRFAGVFSQITPLLDKAKDAVKGFDPARLAGGLERMSQLAPGIASVSAGLLAMGGNSLGLGKLGLSLNPIVAGITALVSASPEGRAAVADLLKALEPLVPVAAELAKLLASSLTVGVQAFAGAVQGVAPAVSLLASAIGALSEGFQALPGPVQLVVGSLAAARVGMALLGTEAGLRLTKPLRDMADSFKANSTDMRGNIGAWHDLAGEVRKTIPEFSNFQAHVEALRTGTGILGKMSTSFMDAAVQAKRFPNAAGAAAAAMTGLKGAASGLLTAIGGPWTVALGAAVWAVTSWGQAQQEAKRRVQELTDAIKADAGALGENTREKVKNRLESEGILKAAQELGVNLKDVTDASLGNADAMARVNTQLAESKRRMAESAAGSINGGEAIQDWQKKVDDLTGALGGQNAEVNAAVESAKRLAAAGSGSAEATQVAAVAQDVLRAGIDAVAGSSDAGSGSVDGMGKSILDMGDNAKDAEKALKALKDMIDGFVGGERALRADDRAVRAAIEEARKAAEEGLGADPKALAARDKAAANLKRAQDALAEKRKKGGKGGTLAAEQRVQKAQEALDAANKKVAASTKTAAEALDEYEAKMDALGEKSERRIQDQVTEGKSLKEIVDGYNQTRAALIAAANAKGIYGKAAEAEADKFSLTKQQLDVLIASYAQLKPEAVTEVKTKGGDKAIAQIQLVKGTIDGVPRIVDIKFGVIDDGVRAAISGITKALGPLGMPFNVFGGLPNFTPRAAGGFDAANGHQAEIAKGGAWRVWAEPETRGESYIPHANDWRRPRAKAILEETARILGAKGVMWHATGAVYRTPVASGAGFDMAALAAALSKYAGQAPTFNAYGMDAEAAVQKAMRDWQFQAAVQP